MWGSKAKRSSGVWRRVQAPMAVFSVNSESPALDLSIGASTKVIGPPWRRVAERVDSLGSA